MDMISSELDFWLILPCCTSDLFGKFQVKRCGLYAGVCGMQITLLEEVTKKNYFLVLYRLSSLTSEHLICITFTLRLGILKEELKIETIDL